MPLLEQDSLSEWSCVESESDESNISIESNEATSEQLQSGVHQMDDAPVGTIAGIELSIRSMVAAHDYDPPTQSSNRYNPTQLARELAFKKNDVISILGDMNPLGYFNGELDGRKGQVPSAFFKLENLSTAEAKTFQALYAQTATALTKERHREGEMGLFMSFFFGLIMGALAVACLTGLPKHTASPSLTLNPWMKVEMKGMEDLHLNWKSANTKLFQRITKLEKGADLRNVTNQVRSLEDLYMDVSKTLQDCVTAGIRTIEDSLGDKADSNEADIKENQSEEQILECHDAEMRAVIKSALSQNKDNLVASSQIQREVAAIHAGSRFNVIVSENDFAYSIWTRNLTCAMVFNSRLVLTWKD